MERRGFLKMASAAGMAGGGGLPAQRGTPGSGPLPSPVIGRAAAGQPSKGKVFALITPHLDDGPIFAGGTIAKLLNEGYTGYFIRVSNDEKDSYNATLGQT